MADKSTGARIVGKVAIKAIPETSDFKTDLKEKLKAIEETTSFTIAVDKAKISKVALRESLQQQLDELRNLKVDVEANVIISEVTKWSFKKDVRDLVKYANGQNASISVAASTAGATTQLRWLARTRFVEIIPTISETAYTKVATQLAALSGLRVTNDWFDNIRDWIENLDKNLPKLALWTGGIANLASALFGLTAGIVGLGQGLVAMSPALLVVPGLIMNSVASLTVLIVALKDAKNQLAPLADGMHELAQIMRDGFWGNARQPILDLVNNLMPQLRTAFTNVSVGVGIFAGSMASALDQKLAGGRLLSIFDNITEGWKTLASGADGFAGALVNLSEIAARYTPRLARWFVRQANAFDSWLTQISTDGRLDVWMEGAITAMYDLWRATTNLGGVFKNLWDAANKAGYEGLNGIADVLQRWNEITSGATFQSGMTSIFVGARLGLQAMGAGLADIGRSLASQTSTVENFLIRAGEIYGTLLSGVAGIIASPSFSAGITTFIDGLKTGIDNFVSYLPGISDTIGGLLDFAGKLADALGSVLGSALSGIGDLLNPLLDSMADFSQRIGPDLADAFDELGKPGGPLDKLGTSLGRLMDAVTDLLDNKKDVIVLGLTAISEMASSAADSVTALIRALTNLQKLFDGDANNWWNSIFDGMNPQSFKGIPLIGAWISLFGEMFGANGDMSTGSSSGMGGGMSVGGMAAMLEEQKAQALPVWESMFASMSSTADGTWNTISQTFSTWSGVVNGTVGTFINGVINWFATLPETIGATVDTMWNNVTSFFETGVNNVINWVKSIPTQIQNVFGSAGTLLLTVGKNIIDGLIAGLEDRFHGVTAFLKNLVDMIPDAIKVALGINSPSKVMRYEVGRWIPAGIELGIQDGMPSLLQTVNQMVSVPTVTPQSVASTYATTNSSVSTSTTIQVFPQSQDVSAIALEVSRYLKFGV